MALYLLIFSAIVATCVFFNKFSGKVGIPVLLFFLMLGLLCGSQYDEFASQRGEEKIIPNGNTILKEGDVLVLLKRDVAVV